MKFQQIIFILFFSTLIVSTYAQIESEYIDSSSYTSEDDEIYPPFDGTLLLLIAITLIILIIVMIGIVVIAVLGSIGLVVYFTKHPRGMYHPINGNNSSDSYELH